MKPLFGAIIFMFMLFLTEIETADNPLKKPRQIKIRPTAAEPDDERRRDDVRTILNIATPARRKKPYQSWAGFEYGKDFDPTGEQAQHMFVDHFQKRGLPKAPDITLELYKKRHNDRGFYHLPEEDSGLCLTDKYYELQKKYADPLVEPHHQEMYKNHQAFQDGSSFRGKLLKIETGSYLPEEQGGFATQRLEEIRKRDGEPFVQQDNQQLYQQHRNFQDHYGGPGSSSRRKSKVKNAQNMSVDHYQEKGLPNTPAATHELNTQRHAAYEQHMYQQHQAFQDQFGGSGSGSDYNYPYTAPPMSPSTDMHSLFYIPPSGDLNFEQNRLQNNPSATVLNDNHYINLWHQYEDRSRGSGSGYHK